MLATGDQSQLDDVVEQSRTLNNRLKSDLEQGRDRLLEMHSNGGEASLELASNIAQRDGDIQLVTFALSLFDAVGLNQEDKGDNALVVTPAEHMMVSTYPGLPFDGATITFDRDVALSREDIQFMSWEHPMIQGGIELLFSEGVGTSALSLLKNKALPVGTLLLELVYVVDAQAPKASGINRYLPHTPIRVLMDAKGNDLSSQVEFESFNRQLSPVNRHMANKLVTSVQSEINNLINQSEPVAEAQLVKVKQQAHQEMSSSLTSELERLLALKAVNPNIRDQEIEALESQIATLDQYISRAQVQLDSVRVIVVSHN
jgi:ATP-dependent helicase HepA